MQYLLFCCFNEKQWENLPALQRDGIMRDYGEWVRSTTSSGHHVAGAQLMPTASARSIRGGNGKAAVTDGPFAETKEQLAGFYMVEARDLNEAIQIAGRIPPARVGSIEVRPIRPIRETVAANAKQTAHQT